MPEAVAVVPRRPFKFLDPYTAADRDIFFGREAEAATLYRLFFSGNVTLVHGQSGTGKTSLVQCGLFSQIDPLSVALFSVRCAGEPLEALRAELLRRLPAEAAAIGDPVELLRATAFHLSRTVALCFDQFEELFLLQAGDVRAELARFLRRALDAHLDLRLIFVLREEFFGRIAELEEHVPELMAQRFWMRRLTRARVEEVVASACRACGVAIEPGLVPVVVGDLTGADGSVELPLVQVVMDRLYDEALAAIVGPSPEPGAARQPLLAAAALESAGGTRNILAHFLDTQLGALDRPAEARDALTLLITASGTKRLMSLGQLAEAMRADPASLATTLDALVQARILRQEGESGRYELRHDILAAEVLASLSPQDRALIQTRALLENRVGDYRTRRLLLDERTLRDIEPYELLLRVTDEERDLLEASRTEVERVKMRNEVNTAAVMWYLASQQNLSLFSAFGRRFFEVFDTPGKDFTEYIDTLRDFVRLGHDVHAPAPPRESIAGEFDFAGYLPNFFATTREALVSHLLRDFRSLFFFEDAWLLGRFLHLLASPRPPPAIAHLGHPGDPTLVAFGNVMLAFAAIESGDDERARGLWQEAMSFADVESCLRNLEGVLEEYEKLRKKYVVSGERAMTSAERRRFLLRLSGATRLRDSAAVPSAWFAEILVIQLRDESLFEEAIKLIVTLGDALGKKAPLELLKTYGAAKSFEEADRLRLQLANTDLAPAAEFYFGFALREAGRERDSLPHFEAAAPSSDLKHYAHYNTALVYEKLGDRGRAAEAFLAAYRSTAKLLYADGYAGNRRRVAADSEVYGDLRALAGEGGDSRWILLAAQYAVLNDAFSEAEAFTSKLDVDRLSSEEIGRLSMVHLAAGAPDVARLLLDREEAKKEDFERHLVAIVQWNIRTARELIAKLRAALPRDAYYYLLETIYLGVDVSKTELEGSVAAWVDAVEKNVELDGEKPPFGVELLKFMLGERSSAELQKMARGEERPEEALAEVSFYAAVRAFQSGTAGEGEDLLRACTESDQRWTSEYQMARSFLASPRSWPSIPQRFMRRARNRAASLSEAASSLRALLRDELVRLVRNGDVDGDRGKALAKRIIDFVDVAESLSDLRQDLEALVGDCPPLAFAREKFYERFGGPALPLYHLVCEMLREGDFATPRALISEMQGVSGGAGEQLGIVMRTAPAYAARLASFAGGELAS
ncbi:MAG: Tetratricopeptide 2 repeat-containing protein [Acidobacteria bacterium]|nr:Tetratricopeptide 2 repeat-containing protein [Acidobacteriota bacterium]